MERYLAILAFCAAFQGCIILPVSYQKFSGVEGTITKNGTPLPNVQIWYAEDRDCMEKGSSVVQSGEDGRFLLEGVRGFPSIINLAGIAHCQSTLCIHAPADSIKKARGLHWACVRDLAPESVIAECETEKADDICSISLPSKRRYNNATEQD